ncbi:MAG TPA: hypothetical protein VJU13_06480 [Candidatus Nitrosocosmicus sp.]|nr:hypothetical protein [Candidatus Nitrosocosmicus sp.]
MGTEDQFTQSGNSKSMVERIPGTWLVQIKVTDMDECINTQNYSIKLLPPFWI